MDAARLGRRRAEPYSETYQLDSDYGCEGGRPCPTGRHNQTMACMGVHYHRRPHPVPEIIACAQCDAPRWRLHVNVGYLDAEVKGGYSLSRGCRGDKTDAARRSPALSTSRQ